MSEKFRMSDAWGKLQAQDEIVIYGVGRIGHRVIPTLAKEFHIPYLIDSRQFETKVFDLDVITIDEASSRLQNRKAKIIVTTVRAAYEEIAKTLSGFGFKEYEDFVWFERFAGEWNLRWHNRCVLSKIDTVITSRCTLKCQNCNMFIGYVKTPQDIEFDSLRRNFDTFFASVDFVYEYTLLGGEPFLHKKLTEVITYLGKRYGDRIGRINLISNGTVLPNDEMLQTLKRYQVTVHISDYTCSLHYDDKLKKAAETLEKAGIEYYIIPNNTWKDVVYPKLTYTADNPREHMLICGHSTHSVDNGRLYWCDPAFAAECFTGFHSKADDSLDLEANRKNNSKFDASINILKYLWGDVNERGYMSICEKCAGVGKDNNHVVIAGIQKKG